MALAAIALMLGGTANVSAGETVNPPTVVAIVTGALTTAASSAASDAPTAVQVLPLELRSLDPSAFGDWDRPVNVQPKFDILAPER